MFLYMEQAAQCAPIYADVTGLLFGTYSTDKYIDNPL